MGRIDRLTNLTEKEEVLWQDRRRYLGLPLSFTIYSFSNNKFYLKKGLFTTHSEEILLYRILDLQFRQTLWQKIFGVGTIVCAFLIGPIADRFLPVSEKIVKKFLHK